MRESRDAQKEQLACARDELCTMEAERMQHETELEKIVVGCTAAQPSFKKMCCD